MQNCTCVREGYRQATADAGPRSQIPTWSDADLPLSRAEVPGSIFFSTSSLDEDTGARPARSGRSSLRCRARAAEVRAAAAEPPGLPTRGALGGYGRLWRRE